MDKREQLILVAALGCTSHEEANEHIQAMQSSNERMDNATFDVEDTSEVTASEIRELYEDMRSDLES